MSDLHERLHRISKQEYFERRKYMRFIVTPPLSRFLYKFRSLDPENEKSIDYLRDLILRSRLWMSSPIDFNDPYDMSANIKIDGNVQTRRERIKDFLKKHGSSRKEIYTTLPQLVKNKKKLLKYLEHGYLENLRTCGVYSFGGDPRSILMWSHYAQNHEGLCLQFEMARDIKCFAGALPVKYSDNFPTVDWVNNFSGDLSTAMLRKFTGWRYEDESRIIDVGAARTYRAFNPEALQGIILGCKVKKATVSKLQDLLEERKSVGYGVPLLYQAVMHDSKFRLVIKRYN